MKTRWLLVLAVVAMAFVLAAGEARADWGTPGHGGYNSCDSHGCWKPLPVYPPACLHGGCYPYIRVYPITVGIYNPGCYPGGIYVGGHVHHGGPVHHGHVH